MQKKYFTPMLFLVAVLAISYSTSYQSPMCQYKTSRINSSEQKEIAVIKLIQPYGESVNKKMNGVIGIVDKSPDKKLPECILGNCIVNAAVATALKKDKSCDIVICLSHPGYQNKGSKKMSDEIIVKETGDIDLIIADLAHTFFKNPIVYKNKKRDDVTVNQVGFAGIISDRPDFDFSKFSGPKLAKSHTISVSQKTG